MFNFTEGDIVTSIAQEQKILQRCHALVWHSQLPQYVQNIKDKATLTKVIQDHVTGVMTQYKGKVRAWDVVNEMFEPHATHELGGFDCVEARELGQTGKESGR